MDQLLEQTASKVSELLGAWGPATNWFVLAAGVAMLLLGAHWLVEGSVTLSRRMGISTLLIGLTVVAFGTSAPELAFNVNAALNNKDALSFGNIIGSNIANIGLVLGLCALLTPLAVHSRVLRRELPWLMVITLAAVCLPLLGVNFLDSLEQGTDLGYGRVAGVLLLAAFALFVLSWYRMGRRAKADPVLQESIESSEHATLPSLPLAAGALILGLALLVVGARVSEFGAVHIAVQLGMSEALVGLTIVAVATSLPEVITSLTACRKGHTDLAIGNVVGSNLFNLLLVLGTTAVVAPVALPERAWWNLAFMAGMTVLLLPMALTQKRIDRCEGALLLLLYVGYMVFECLMTIN